MSTKLRFIAAHAAEHAVHLMCAVLGGCRSWFYDWQHGARLRAEREARRAALVAEILAVFDGSQGRYGAPRIKVFYNRRRRHSSIGYRTPAQTRLDMEPEMAA